MEKGEILPSSVDSIKHSGSAPHVLRGARCLGTDDGITFVGASGPVFRERRPGWGGVRVHTLPACVPVLTAVAVHPPSGSENEFV